MTEQEILAKLLAGSDRWCCNYQPPAQDVASVLSKLPVVDVEASADILRIRFARPLTGGEAYALAMLGQDKPEEIGDTTTAVTLWWD